MKNPMDRQLAKSLSDRAVAIGREGEASAFEELLEMLNCPDPNVRRLSASALGKLAWLGVDQERAVAALAPLVRKDPHDQTRQYAIKALKAYGAVSAEWIHDLRDIARNPGLKDYIRRDATAAADFIEEAVRRKEASKEHRCLRCHATVTAEEYARAQ